MTLVLEVTFAYVNTINKHFSLCVCLEIRRENLFPLDNKMMPICVTVHEFIDIESRMIVIGEELGCSDDNVFVSWALRFSVSFLFRLMTVGASTSCLL